MNIEEILYLETNYSCAWCGNCLKGNLTIHHIDGDRENNKYDNKIVMCHNCHTGFHTKKGIPLEDIKGKKKILIMKTLTQYGVNALKESYRNEFGVCAIPFLLYHLVDMGYMKKEEETQRYGGVGKGEPYIEELARFVITGEGKKLCEKWQL